MVKISDDKTPRPQSQLDKFKATAKQVETDDSEDRFDRTLRRVAKATPSEKPKAPK